MDERCASYINKLKELYNFDIRLKKYKKYISLNSTHLGNNDKGLSSYESDELKLSLDEFISLDLPLPLENYSYDVNLMSKDNLKLGFIGGAIFPKKILIGNLFNRFTRQHHGKDKGIPGIGKALIYLMHCLGNKLKVKVEVAGAVPTALGFYNKVGLTRKNKKNNRGFCSKMFCRRENPGYRNYETDPQKLLNENRIKSRKKRK